MRGGSRVGAGRPKGATSYKTKPAADAAKIALAEGITPLEVILRTMQHMWNEAQVLDAKTGKMVLDPAKAKDAVVVANSAAPYCHAKIAPKEEIPPKPPESEEVDLLDGVRRMAFALRASERQVPALPAPAKAKRKVAA